MALPRRTPAMKTDRWMHSNITQVQCSPPAFVLLPSPLAYQKEAMPLRPTHQICSDFSKAPLFVVFGAATISNSLSKSACASEKDRQIHAHFTKSPLSAVLRAATIAYRSIEVRIRHREIRYYMIFLNRDGSQVSQWHLGNRLCYS